MVGMIKGGVPKTRKCTVLTLCEINLKTSKIKKEDISHLGPLLLGGRGVNHALILERTRKTTEPLDPDYPIAIGTGLLVGTEAPGAVRTNVASVNPLSGGIGSSSAGGGFACAMRRAGVDHLVIHGRSPDPACIVIENDTVTVANAKHLWGLSTGETVSQLRKEYGANIEVACIGPAGENRAYTACILFTGGRAAGRCGLGAVLGAKHVKCIVAKGTANITVANNPLFKSLKESAEEVAQSSDLLQLLSEYGTLAYGAVDVDATRVAPGHNYQMAEPAYRPRLSDFQKYRVSSTGPEGCPIPCGQAYEIKAGKFAGLSVQKCEGNSLEDFGFRVGLTSPEAILKAHAMCQEFGLDVDKASGTIAWALECYQRGLLDRNDTGGIDLAWGDASAVFELLDAMAHRRGFGDIIADGCRKAATQIGRNTQQYCMTIKGEELEEAIRPYKAWALGVVVSERAGGHTRGAPLTEFGDIPESIAEEVWGVGHASEAHRYDQKAKLVVYYEQLHAILDSLGLCYFMSNWMEPSLLGPQELAELTSAATGWECSSESLMRIGERIHTIGKLFNMAVGGFGRKDDYPPERLQNEPVDSGPCAGELLDRANWDELLDDYYRLHGWDTETGNVRDETLRDLRLEKFDSCLTHEEGV